MTWTADEAARVAALETSIADLQALNLILKNILKQIKNLHRADRNGNCISCPNDYQDKHLEMKNRLPFPCAVSTITSTLT